MLRISRLTDYAIVLLAHLAGGDSGELQNARELARAAALPLPVVSKILKALTRAGLLQSQRGARGGYVLVRAPEQVSVAELLDALEGPVALTECGAHPGVCQQEASCRVRDPWQRINRAIRETLERVTLADLVRASEPSLIPPDSLFGQSAGASRSLESS